MRGHTADKVEYVRVHRQALAQLPNAMSALNIHYLYTLSTLLYYTDSRKGIYFVCESSKRLYKKTVHMQILGLR